MAGRAAADMPTLGCVLHPARTWVPCIGHAIIVIIWGHTQTGRRRSCTTCLTSSPLGRQARRMPASVHAPPPPAHAPPVSPPAPPGPVESGLVSRSASWSLRQVQPLLGRGQRARAQAVRRGLGCAAPCASSWPAMHPPQHCLPCTHTHRSLPSSTPSPSSSLSRPSGFCSCGKWQRQEAAALSGWAVAWWALLPGGPA